MATTSVGHKAWPPIFVAPLAPQKNQVLFLALGKGHSMERVWQIGRFWPQLLASGRPEFVSQLVTHGL